MWRKFQIISVVFLFCCVSTPARADHDAEAYRVVPTVIGDLTSVEFQSNSYMSGFYPSHLEAAKKSDPSSPWFSKVCTSTDDPVCKGPEILREYYALFPNCTSQDQTNCIESVWGYDPMRNKVLGIFVEEWNSPNYFPADASLNMPEGRGASTWEIPGVNGSGSNLFGVVVGEHGGEYDQGRRYVNETGAKQKPFDFFISLQPTSIVSRGANASSSKFVNSDTDPNGTIFEAAAESRHCLFIDMKRCASKESFVTDARYGISIRVKNQLTPWFFGRLGAPSIQVLKGSVNTQLIVEATSLKVPIITGQMPFAKLPISFLNNFKQIKTAADLREIWGGIWNQGDAGRNALQLYDIFQSSLDPLAKVMKSAWEIRTISQVDYLGEETMTRCSGNSGFAGLVASNASVYASGPPVFSEPDQSLNYKVGSVHFDDKGNVINGFYSLSLRSDVARCLYGFTDAPINARVEVLSEGESQNVATTVLKDSNGWLNLVASGFHYSSPTVKVKLTQAKDETPVVAPISQAPIAAPQTAAVKRSITCINGKNLKKVTAVNPKCPVGYKKK